MARRAGRSYWGRGSGWGRFIHRAVGREHARPHVRFEIGIPSVRQALLSSSGVGGGCGGSDAPPGRGAVRCERGERQPIVHRRLARHALMLFRRVCIWTDPDLNHGSQVADARRKEDLLRAAAVHRRVARPGREAEYPLRVRTTDCVRSQSFGVRLAFALRQLVDESVCPAF